jgi:hypothetical protein
VIFLVLLYMTLFGKGIDNFARKVGKSMNYNTLRQIGNKVAMVADNGLRLLDKAGGIGSSILATSAQVANGLGFGVVGAGLGTAKNLVDMGRKGVQGLEKAVSAVKQSGTTFDRNSTAIKNAITNGDAPSIINHTKAVLNPLKGIY